MDKCLRKGRTKTISFLPSQSIKCEVSSAELILMYCGVRGVVGLLGIVCVRFTKVKSGVFALVDIFFFIFG
jgi:hypothetical protein